MSEVTEMTRQYWIDTLLGWAEDRLAAPQFDECKRALAQKSAAHEQEWFQAVHDYASEKVEHDETRARLAAAEAQSDAARALLEELPRHVDQDYFYDQGYTKRVRTALGPLAAQPAPAAGETAGKETQNG